MKGRIELKGMRFFAYHGVFQQERSVGGEFMVNISYELSSLKSVESDDLNDTISYADVYELVRQKMQIPSQLLEHVAGEIVKSLKTQFPLMRAIKLSISKLCPPMGGEVQSATFILEE